MIKKEVIWSMVSLTKTYTEKALERIADSLEKIVKMLEIDTPKIDTTAMMAAAAIAAQITKPDLSKMPKKIKL